MKTTKFSDEELNMADRAVINWSRFSVILLREKENIPSYSSDKKAIYFLKIIKNF